MLRIRLTGSRTFRHLGPDGGKNLALCFAGFRGFIVRLGAQASFRRGRQPGTSGRRIVPDTVTLSADVLAGEPPFEFHRTEGIPRATRVLNVLIQAVWQLSGVAIGQILCWRWPLKSGLRILGCGRCTAHTPPSNQCSKHWSTPPRRLLNSRKPIDFGCHSSRLQAVPGVVMYEVFASDEDQFPKSTPSVTEVASRFALESDDEESEIEGRTSRAWDDDRLQVAQQNVTWPDDPLRLYLNQIGKIPLLTHKQEIALSPEGRVRASTISSRVAGSNLRLERR